MSEISSSIVSGIQSEEEDKEVNQKYLSQNKKEKINAFAQEKQNWGKNKSKYYKEDADSGDSDAELEEEMEAKALQLQAAKKIQDADVWDVHVDQEQQEFEYKTKQLSNEYNLIGLQCLSEEIGIEPEIIEKMDVKELNTVILKGWPELKGILKEITQVGKEIKILKRNCKKEKGSEIKKYLTIRIELMQSYFGLLWFYLHLRARTRLSQHHPIFKKINDLKELIEQSESYEKYAQLIQMNVDQKEKEESAKKKEVKRKEQTKKQEEGQDTLSLKRKLKNIYNNNNREDVDEKKISKIKKLLEDVDRTHHKNENKEQDSESRISVNSGDMLEAMKDVDEHLEEGGMDEIYEENLKRIKDKKKQKRDEKKVERLENFQKLNKLQKLHEVGEDDPRKITYVMLKNLSLMRRRRGNRIKNSRVKHKLKYEKALYKLKSQNKYIKNPVTSNYVGEGAIKSGVVKGVRLQ
ncbi:unnamed protein product (macronuclear) [Paramecium tetraurelia]|uniref:Sas10 C-terminal domain-containing protein n=1 Tax=Paramecium tetraurelia TaxID=5888 RepID=A0DDV4_PARTE|nr:uncharacterized protein GSPATT00016062001 [Paramecium tetraurelia]CAK81221.1 unnamed protein product [Paramecium tetraurelia]|eukprot:XP_001448618.1 hypothetical protein (macronuclear) [Paramecium tetraurelia strain d4-2]